MAPWPSGSACFNHGPAGRRRQPRVLWHLDAATHPRSPLGEDGFRSRRSRNLTTCQSLAATQRAIESHRGQRCTVGLNARRVATHRRASRMRSRETRPGAASTSSTSPGQLNAGVARRPKPKTGLRTQRRISGTAHLRRAIAGNPGRARVFNVPRRDGRYLSAAGAAGVESAILALDPRALSGPSKCNGALLAIAQRAGVRPHMSSAIPSDQWGALHNNPICPGQRGVVVAPWPTNAPTPELRRQPARPAPTPKRREADAKPPNPASRALGRRSRVAGANPYHPPSPSAHCPRDQSRGQKRSVANGPGSPLYCPPTPTLPHKVGGRTHWRAHYLQILKSDIPPPVGGGGGRGCRGDVIRYGDPNLAAVSTT